MFLTLVESNQPNLPTSGRPSIPDSSRMEVDSPVDNDSTKQTFPSDVDNPVESQIFFQCDVSWTLLEVLEAVKATFENPQVLPEVRNR